jgi:hypothetical protein
VHDPKCFDQRCSGHWIKTLLSFIFVTFERYVISLRGTFVLFPISAHPTVQGAGERWMFSPYSCSFGYGYEAMVPILYSEKSKVDMNFGFLFTI